MEHHTQIATCVLQEMALCHMVALSLTHSLAHSLLEHDSGMLHHPVQAYLQLSGSSSAGRLPLLLLGFSSPTSQGTQQSAGPPAEQPEDLQVVVAAAEGQAAGMQATCTGSSSHSHSGRADSQACSSTAAPSSEQAPGHEADTSSPQGPQQAGTSDTPTDLAAEPAGLQQVRCQLAWSSETARTTRGLSPAVRTALRRVLASAAGLPATRVSIDCLRRDLKAGCWAAQLVVDCGTDGAAARQLLGVLARPEQISELLDAPGAGVVQVLGPVDPAAVCARVVRLEDMMEHATSLDQRGQQGSGGGTGCAEAVAVGNEKGGSVTSSAATAAAHAEPSSAVTVVAAEPASAAGSGAVVTAEPAASPGSSERRLALPYLGYKLVDGEGRPVERPDKHPFCLSRCGPGWAAATASLHIHQRHLSYGRGHERGLAHALLCLSKAETADCAIHQGS